jgi:TRAP-type C4-dicarboxylate transport system substrate-binding protein
MGINTRIAVLLATVAAAIVGVDAQSQPVKMGTIAPDGSIYVTTLREMGDAWKKRTNGRLTLTVYAGGDATESEMLFNMRPSARKLHAAQLSAITLGHVDDAFNVFGLPMFFESYEEADRVLARIGPMLEQRLEAKGYKVLNWAYVGWVHVFSRTPVKTVDDLKKLKLYTSAGDDRMAKWYRANGFRAVPLDSTSIVTSLKTSMIEAVPAPPVFAQLLGWYESAPYMMDVGFAPLLGATVMSLERWKSLPPTDQEIVIDEARKAGDRLRKRIPRQEQEAIAEMKKRRLTVTAVDRAEWRRMAEELGGAMRRDGTVPADVYDIAKRERDAARAGR